MALEVGKQLGPYKILGSAGAGGMGEVYKATDTRLDREVAIKVLHAKVANSADIKERFEREAKVIAGLNHPNICTLFDIGEAEGIDYLVMEFIEGETLSDRLAKGPLPNEELLTVAIQIADALDKAHKQGLVHRDLKPGNVMLTKEGAKLLDFGLAKFTPQAGFLDALSSAETRTTPLTTQGAIIGTLQFMAPEQLEGEEADARSDIFAFGATLYQMATGQNAFAGKSRASLIASVLKEQPRDISEITTKTPLALEKVIKQCLSKDPEQRWQSAGDLKRSLELIRDGASNVTVGSAKPSSSSTIVLGVVTAVLLVTTAFFGYLAFNQEEIQREVIHASITAPAGTRLAGLAGGSLALSPDGKMVVFNAADTINGKEFLWVRKFDSPTSIKLAGTSDSWMPFWSSDSRYIAFFIRGKLKKILATGGPTLTLCDAPNGRTGSWNQNDVIIFTPNSVGPLFQVSAAGGQAKQLTTLDSTNNDLTHRWPSFLPDGDHYLYYARTGSATGGEKDAIRIGALSTGKQEHLIHAKSNAAFARGHIVYARNNTLMAQPFDLDKLALVGDGQPIAENVSFVDNYSRSLFTLSPDGKIIFRTGELQLGSMITVFDSSGLALDSIGDWETQYTISLSPDERYVAGEIDSQSGWSNIWIHDISRGIKRRMTFDSLNSFTPVWSPDGESIAYITQTGDSTIIYRRSADGMGDATHLFASKENMFLSSWSADGKYLFAAKRSNPDAAWILPLDSIEKSRRIFDLASANVAPVLSADGRWLAFTSDESGNPEVYVTSFPAVSGKWQVSINNGDKPKWSADGKRLYYLDDKGVINVAEVGGSGSSFHPGAVRALFKISGEQLGNTFAINSDGTKFYVNQLPSGSNKKVEPMTMILNWDALLTDKK